MSESAENGNWDDDFKDKEESSNNSGDGQRRLDWIRFPAPGNYKIRLCGQYVKFYRWWSPFTERVITHMSYKDKDPAWNAGFWPRKTFAIHVIDRNDTDEAHPTGKLKILEKGNSIFQAFANCKKVNEFNPASADGVDFNIKVTWPENNKRNANYEVTPIFKKTPFTPEELAMLKAEFVELKSIYKATPLEKIQELWDALPDDAKIPPERDGGKKVQQVATPAAPVAPTPPPIVEEVSAGSSAEDDLFGDNTTF